MLGRGGGQRGQRRFGRLLGCGFDRGRRGNRGGGSALGGHTGLAQPLANRLDNRLTHLDPRVAAIGALDDHPGGVGRGSPLHRLLGRLEPDIIITVLPPLVRPHLPGRGPVAPQPLEPPLLFLFADVQPNLSTIAPESVARR